MRIEDVRYFVGVFVDEVVVGIVGGYGEGFVEFDCLEWFCFFEGVQRVDDVDCFVVCFNVLEIFVDVYCNVGYCVC